MKTIVQLKLENFLNDRGLLEQFERDCKEIGYTIESLCERQINLFNRRGSNNIIYNDYNHIIFHGKYLYTDISITELSVFMDISYCISNL